MSRTPCFTSFFGIGSMPHSGMPGPPCGPAVLQHQHVIGGDVEIVALDSRAMCVVVLEHQRRAAMLVQALLRGRRLHHAAARREIALEHARSRRSL